eukprot:CAMPEP_0115447286 /NCGR_PEP_ID=MMETSP0271-20121206/39890_1 /TAXON_ID=71861 /ORGANISM="Scrippsiella trochoidea, Strain CCMP3099" /LENGTH=38 /DNA_ID= /DNA_START= /DNA_END= /DNA_ORIENTATION=
MNAPARSVQHAHTPVLFARNQLYPYCHHAIVRMGSVES